jgi:hypothetical protein
MAFHRVRWLGQYAAQLLVHEQQREWGIKKFAVVMATGRSWGGAFAIRCKDGGMRLVELRTMRLLDDRGGTYALRLGTGSPRLREVERESAR